MLENSAVGDPLTSPIALAFVARHAAELTTRCLPITQRPYRAKFNGRGEGPMTQGPRTHATVHPTTVVMNAASPAAADEVV